MIEGWKNSPGHRANMLSASKTDGATAYKADGRRTYGTQLFGKK